MIHDYDDDDDADDDDADDDDDDDDTGGGGGGGGHGRGRWASVQREEDHYQALSWHITTMILLRMAMTRWHVFISVYSGNMPTAYCK